SLAAASRDTRNSTLTRKATGRCSGEYETNSHSRPDYPLAHARGHPPGSHERERVDDRSTQLPPCASSVTKPPPVPPTPSATPTAPARPSPAIHFLNTAIPAARSLPVTCSRPSPPPTSS